MTYDPNIPQATDIISQSQGQLLTNFGQANTAFGIDHTAFSVVANQGFHKKVTFQAVIANPNQIGPIASLYTKTGTSKSELFYQNDSNAGAVSQITGGAGIGAAGWVCFNGNTGAINSSLNIASVTRNSAGNYTIAFTRNFSATSYVACVSCFSQINFPLSWKEVAKNVGSFQFAAFGYFPAQAASDPSEVSIIFFGALV